MRKKLILILLIGFFVFMSNPALALYINFNGTIELTVNASDNAIIKAEIQRPKAISNSTMWYNGTLYILQINKTLLGDLQDNVSRNINITNIYINGQNYSESANTTTLNFSYATTQMTGVSVSPSPVTNNTGQTVTFMAFFNDTSGNSIPNADCNLTLGAYRYQMSYSSQLYYAAGVATSAYSANTYSYNITCVNSSYQTQENATEWLQIKYGSGGTVGGSGGTSPIYSVVSAVINKTLYLSVKPASFTVFIQNDVSAVCYEKEDDCYFMIYNPNSFTANVKIYVNSTDESRGWITFSDRNLRDVSVNIPAASALEDGYFKVPFVIKSEFAELGNYKSIITIRHENNTVTLPINIYVSDGSNFYSIVNKAFLLLGGADVVNLPKPVLGKASINLLDITVSLLFVFIFGIGYRIIVWAYPKKRRV